MATWLKVESQSGEPLSESNPLPVKTSQGTPASDADAWPVKVTTSVPAGANKIGSVDANVTAADGAIASVGTKADVAVTDPTLSASEIALLKGLLQKQLDLIKQLQGTGTGATPVSLASLPSLPEGTNNIGSVDANVAAVDGSIASMGATTDEVVTDPAMAASQIALLKGVIAQQQTVIEQLRGTGTGATPVSVTGSSLTQPLITETMDFCGKTSGRTFDVPHVAKYECVMEFNPPSSSSWTEFDQERYTPIYTWNGFTGSNAMEGAGLYTQHLFSFDLLTDLKLKGRIPMSWTVDRLKAALKAFTVTLVGYGTGSNGGVKTDGVVIKFWKPEIQVWSGSMGSNAASTLAAIVSAPMTPLNYIDSNGFFHILVHSTYPSDGTIASTIYTDYVKVDVQLYGEYLLTDHALTYDPANKASRVVTKNRTVVDTVVNAASVAAGGNTTFDLGITDESELWLLVSIDQQPWSLVAGVPWKPSHVYGVGKVLFPERAAVATAFPNVDLPASSLYLGNDPLRLGVTVSTIEEARAILTPPYPGVTGRLVNSSADIATVTIKAMRVWR